MGKSFVFSWAEDANGKMVHVDSVPNGLECKCVCPNCRESLLARHGESKEHGFAHHSENRKANLKICYMVILYKLAEHILQTKKRIHVPSYYGIYEETDIEFTDVKVDSRYEREDKQPDVIGITKDNQQYLIEFTFQYKVQHKKDINYHNLTCLEIDLSKQTLESLEEFLMKSSEDRKWVNNENYFNLIEKTKRDVKIVSESDCSLCELKDSCCAMKQPSLCFPREIPIQIKNNGQKFRICKVKEYDLKLQRLRKEEDEYNDRRKVLIEKDKSDNTNDLQERSCFDCEKNLTWKNKEGMANCGCYERLKIPQKNNPSYAKDCRMFKRKNK